MKKRYMGVDLHRNCFTVYTRQADGSGESREWSLRELKAFARIFLRLDQTQQGNSRSLFQMMKGMFSEKNWNVVQ